MKHCTSPLSRFLLLAIALFLATPLKAAEEPSPVTAFSPDPGHLWNRLYTTLKPPATTGLEPFLNPPTAETRAAAVALLTELPKSDAVPAAPLQRAVMQRSLLLHLYAALEREHQNANQVQKPDRELVAALVPAIRKIALSAGEIRKLPDNYASAVARPDAVTADNPKNPAPFLPKDLLADDGPWIALDLTPKGGRQGVAAAFHFQFYRGSTSFEVRMRHPEGRAAGEAYLQKLAAMPEPYLKEATPESQKLVPNGPDWRHPNPETPQFPPGTAWALIHRAILADSNGRPVVSPLVEGVQIRVYRTLSIEEILATNEFKAEVAVLKAEGKKFDSDFVAANHYQTAFEWTMRGPLPLENKGFHLSASQDTVFAEGRKDVPLVSVCTQCHFASGIHSVNTRAGLFHNEKMSRAPEFQPATRARLDEVMEGAAQKQLGWSQLRERWGK